MQYTSLCQNQQKSPHGPPPVRSVRAGVWTPWMGNKQRGRPLRTKLIQPGFQGALNDLPVDIY